jgi:hypothetical protein
MFIPAIKMGVRRRQGGQIAQPTGIVVIHIGNPHDIDAGRLDDADVSVLGVDHRLAQAWHRQRLRVKLKFDQQTRGRRLHAG